MDMNKLIVGDLEIKNNSCSCVDVIVFDKTLKHYIKFSHNKNQTISMTHIQFMSLFNQSINFKFDGLSFSFETIQYRIGLNYAVNKIQF